MNDFFDSSYNAKPHLMLFTSTLGGGGAERVVADLALNWHKAGHQVTVVTQSTPESDAYELGEGVERIALDTVGLTGFMGHLKRVRRLRKVLRQRRPDILIGFMTSASIFCLLASRGMSSVKVIATEHAYPPSQQLSKTWAWLRRKTYPNAAAVVTLAQGSADWLRDSGIKADYAVIPNAVNWPIRVNKPELKLPKKDGEKWLLAVGRLHVEKGFDRLIEAFSLIARAQPAWKLIILGAGAEEKSLHELIESKGLASRVVLAGRAGNMPWWYEKADMYVLSSRAEGLSNSLQEAMSSGLPAVAVNCPVGPREIIRDGIDGVLVDPPDSPEALAKALIDLMNDPARRRALATRAVDTLDRFSMARIMQKWEDLFNSIESNKN